ncbi:3',5'-cyclic AMP phosphodiesterase CpdA [Gramella sp. Hel_I_59]|uniref:metallophosphoesterase family protein n=1 Tax=Gramella sp. Hel_I_59 TaxID=1249978 RepID=UPI00114FAB62|nr:metallophosphoesterase [Gramella sp. Hel_I_59]TQI71436.1 3',5'-cyclic AMP phosphodiesterase CpdA [Gramella sp. Hel_I_59]
MKLCIISDLHCTEKKGNSSFFYSDIPDVPINQNPISSILKKIGEDKSTHSDIVLCLGDLGDKAYKQGIKSAWEGLNRIKNEMNAEILIGIPGNHDVNSRKTYVGEKPFEYIENFSINFPTPDKESNLKFWQEGYCIYEFKDFEILMINTVLNHIDEASAGISEISHRTLEAIEEELNSDEQKIKICILHHHPIKHSNIENWRDADSLDRGDTLLTILNRYNYDLVIHGHKHQPRIVERDGLTIFASGSFSSFENLQGTGFKTMFHVVDIKSKSKGKIFSWEYNIQNGWEVELNHRFPPEIGFGERVNLNTLAKKIKTTFDSFNSDAVLYESVMLANPELDYMTPETLIKLGDLLNKQFNLVPQPEFPLKPAVLTSR